jgi:hypothetical protein
MLLNCQDLDVAGGKLKAYLIRKPEEIQNNQFGASALTFFVLRAL